MACVGDRYLQREPRDPKKIPTLLALKRFKRYSKQLITLLNHHIEELQGLRTLEQERLAALEAEITAREQGYSAGYGIRSEPDPTPSRKRKPTLPDKLKRRGNPPCQMARTLKGK